MLMKKIALLSLIICFSFFQGFAKSDTTKCNWKSYISNFYTWDTCQGNIGKNSINAYIAIKGKTCLKYAWTINNSTLNTGASVINKRITSNGTYTICVKVTDTCNKCDTTLCYTRTISCFSKCNWKAKLPSITSFDTCKGNGGRNSMNAYLAINSRTCLKYQWSVNGNIQNTKNYFINYPITQNGTYNLCVKIIDTCNNCDTTICTTRSFTCFKPCNWKAKSIQLYAFDTCQGNSSLNSINGYVSISNRACLKYIWSVNGTLLSSSNYYLHYPVTKNGTYDLCVKVIDTCNKCDTTICSTRTISCFSGGSSKCNFKARTPYFFAWDTCKGNGGANSVNAYINFQSFYCFKYEWSVNGVKQSTQNFVLNYPVKTNGTYIICVKVIDSCGGCDTVFCASRSVSCFSTCNWKSKLPSINSFDTCKGNGARNSMNAYLAINSRACLKYQWSVNGVTQSTKNYYINYPITKNGNYILCVKITDTCNKCDTTICVTRSFTCFSNCNWKANTPYYFAWDTCRGTGGSNSVNAYISMKNSTCNKYSWTVNGVAAGNTNVMHHGISQNGAYVICVKVTDTCKKCDTTFCTTRSITCFNSCDFKSRTPYFTVWDSCSGSKSNLNGYITFYNRNCMKYEWTLDSQKLGNGSRNISIPITKNGTYTLCVKITDTCFHCDTTLCISKTINCKGLGIAAYDWTQQIEIFPNPANEIFIIKSNAISNVSYSIGDILGKQIVCGKLNAQQQTILSTSDYSNGVYWVRISYKEGDKIIKLIINH